jgi:hypothetical protein
MKVIKLYLAIFLGAIFLTTNPDCLVISANADEMPRKSLKLFQKVWDRWFYETPAWIELNNVSKHLWLEPGHRTGLFHCNIVRVFAAIRDHGLYVGCTCELATKEKRIELIWRLINEICLLQERTKQNSLVYTSFCTGEANLDPDIIDPVLWAGTI